MEFTYYNILTVSQSKGHNFYNLLYTLLYVKKEITRSYSYISANGKIWKKLYIILWNVEGDFTNTSDTAWN